MHIISLRDGQHPLLAFDTETTGIDALTDHIITWGSSSEDDPEREEVLRLPDSVTELDEGNVAVHGYSLEKIAEIGQDRKDGLLSAFTLLDEFNETTTGFIVGHNITYDMTILFHELSREGFTDEAKKISSWRVLDTFPLLESSHLIGAFKMSLKLNVIAETLDVDRTLLDNAHNAGADSLVAAALLEKVLLYFPHMSAMTSDELMEYMHEAARACQYKKLPIFEDSMVGFPVLKPLEKASAESRSTSAPDKKPAQKKKTTKKTTRKSTSGEGRRTRRGRSTSRAVRKSSRSRSARDDKRGE